jgi:hypothetical protein
MRAGRVSYTVERFGTAPSFSGPGCRLTVSGWFHADSAVKSMSLEIVAGHPVTYPIAAFTLPSLDVAEHFGEAAEHKRFSLSVDLDQENVKIDDAYLQVILVAGDELLIDISNMFKPHVIKPTESAKDLVMYFESLGDNCEFGLMQRQVGTERLGLFRYAGTLSTKALIEGLNARFAGFATKDDLQFHTFHGEWICVSRRYGYVFHTRRFEATATEEQVREEEAVHLSFLARMLLEDIEDGEKVFVRRLGGFEATGPEHGMEALYAALRAIGPARLLWITPVNAQHPAAQVLRLDEGLFRGYIARLGPYENAHDFSVPAWIDLLSAAAQTMGLPYTPAPLLDPLGAAAEQGS